MAEGLLGSREASGALPCGAPAPGFGVPPCAQSGTSCFVEPLLPIWNPQPFLLTFACLLPGLRHSSSQAPHWQVEHVEWEDTWAPFPEGHSPCWSCLLPMAAVP